jgi:hypothetical protein
VVLLTLFSCTDPVERPSPITVSVDADSVVRMNTVRVEIVIEGQADDKSGRGTTWEELKKPIIFKPDPANEADWPWKDTILPEDSTRDRYSLKAIAKDKQGAVVAQAQAVRDRTYVKRSGLRVHFDTACFRHEKCDDGYTCTAGECVDAATLTALPAADGGMDTTAPNMPGTPGAPTAAPDGIATEGAPCSQGRACAGHASSIPMSCEGGAWRAQAPCAQTDRCSTMKGDTLGTCRPITDECRNRKPNIEYCDGETMKVCPDLIVSEVRMCAEHESCRTEGASAKCRCSDGYVNDGTDGPCIPASTCSVNRGGCDALTECTMVGGQPACSACPPGYSGTGKQGCEPLMQDIELSAGTLEPAFSPTMTAYHAQVSLLTQRVVITPTVPAGTTVTVNGDTLDALGSWTSPVLKLGETPVDLSVTSSGGVTNDYTVTFTRNGVQEAYLKASNAETIDHFGILVDVSGDTLVASSWYEDSAATGVNGNQNDNSAENAGAVYVFVREGESWKQQAYLKPNDTSAYDLFGSMVKIEGDTIVVGATHENIFTSASANRSGAVYVFTRKDGVWTQTQRLVANDQNGVNLLGASLALQGDTLAVGAPGESSKGANSGAVYIFERSGSMWTQMHKIYSSMPGDGAVFGGAVAIGGDRLVVGAPDESRPESHTGSAEVFVKRDGKWTSQQRLQPPGLGQTANFGFAISISGNRIAIGAPRTHQILSMMSTPPGEVYIYDAEGDGWTQTAKLTATIPTATDEFGVVLALSGMSLAVGASEDVSGAAGIGADPKRKDSVGSGAVYLFALDASGWVQSAYIKPTNPMPQAWFGFSVAMDRGVLVVGSHQESGSGKGVNPGGMSGGAADSGAVYVFR